MSTQTTDAPDAQAEPPYSPEDLAKAQADEREARWQAIYDSSMAAMEERTVRLNLEVRIRDRRIVELEKEKVTLERELAEVRDHLEESRAAVADPEPEPESP